MSFMPKTVPDRKLDKSLLGHLTKNKVNGHICNNFINKEIKKINVKSLWKKKNKVNGLSRE